ncbi:MAG: tetratricopeptide repeat protein [Chloroflexi bacterium]|nr:tetratricopeptide repeat protein [Chloroflexota bacterium]
MIHKSVHRPLATFLALALFAVVLVFILSPLSTPYLDLIRQGDEHVAKAERTAAVVAYREAAGLRPNDPAPYLRMAQVYLEWGRAEDALDVITRGEQLDAEGVALARLRVTAYIAQADWPAVVEQSHRLLILVPTGRETSSVRHTLARAYVEQQAWDAAQTEYETLLRDNPTDSLAREWLGVLLFDDDPIAIQHLFAADTDLSLRLLAVLQEPGVADNPAYTSALVGQVFLEEQEWVLAARHLKRALADNPDYADAHAYLGHVFDQMGYPDEAGFHLTRAVELFPDSTVARTFLGLHYERLGNVSAARAQYEIAYDLDPENPATCVEIGHTWAAEGRYVAAEIWLEEAVSLQPDDPVLWQILTRFYLDHNITSEGQGVEAAIELVMLVPNDARAHDLKGWAALQVGDYGTARDSLLQAVSLDPMLASGHYHLGLLWTAQADYQKAQEAFARALDLDSTGELLPLVERAVGEFP